MKILGIESSCEAVSVALWLDGAVYESAVDGAGTPSARLIPTISSLLASHGACLKDIDVLALGVGPGAFTSVRLGCSVAQGLALALSLKIVPGCSLELMAASQRDARVFVATDARMGEVYVAAYETTLELPLMITPPACLPPELVELAGGHWTGVGSGFTSYPDRLLPDAEKLTARLGDLRPRAGDLVRLAALRGMSAGHDPEHVGPLYVRDKVALTVAERVARGGRA